MGIAKAVFSLVTGACLRLKSCKIFITKCQNLTGFNSYKHILRQLTYYDKNPDMTAEIQFDPKGHETQIMYGPWKNRADAISACNLMGGFCPHWDAYQLWALDVGANGGSIITSAWNPAMQQSRSVTLQKQLNGTDTNEYIVPPLLKEVFTEAARSRRPLNVLTFSTTQEILYHQLAKLDLRNGNNLRFVCNDPDLTHAAECNAIVASNAPTLTKNIIFTPNWQDDHFDIVHFNADIFYREPKDVRALLKQIRDTGVQHVVFSNVLGKPEHLRDGNWFLQRWRGGMIPWHNYKNLPEIMAEFNFRMVKHEKAETSYKVGERNTFHQEIRTQDNYVFERIP